MEPPSEKCNEIKRKHSNMNEYVKPQIVVIMADAVVMSAQSPGDEPPIWNNDNNKGGDVINNPSPGTGGTGFDEGKWGENE